MIGMAIWLMDRIMPHQWNLMLWSGLIIFVAIYLGALRKNKRNNLSILIRTVSLLILVYGITLFITIMLSHSKRLFSIPISFNPNTINQSIKAPVIDMYIKNASDLAKAMAIAREKNMPFLLDFYADWCESCKEFDKNILSNVDVSHLTQQMFFARVDLTKVDSDTMNLAKRFNVAAPPAIFFFDSNGKRINVPAIVNESQDNLMRILRSVLAGQQ